MENEAKVKPDFSILVFVATSLSMSILDLVTYFKESKENDSKFNLVAGIIFAFLFVAHLVCFVSSCVKSKHE